ncbi:MAG TPA: GNAT family N-acetyltransferase [Beijerinckiaceae bacterium]|jgi:hypothetical protein
MPANRPSDVVLALQSAEPDPPIPGASRPFAASDFLDAAGGLAVRRASPAELSRDAAGTLFVHPAWLGTYGLEDLVVVEGPARREGAARLVFARRDDHLVHLGRLTWLDADCVAVLTDRLLGLDGVAFVVFEDVRVEGALARRPGQSVFHYQNNWQLVLNGPGETDRIARQTAQATARKLRGLTRDREGVRIGFDRDPSGRFLRTVVAYNRLKIEAQGRRHGIDEAEFARLSALSAELGWGSVLEDKDGIVAGDLVFVTGRRAYFMTGGYDAAAQRYSPGMITLIHAIEECRRQGILDFNLMWGDGAYKQRLGAHCRPLVTIVARGSAAALLRPSYLGALGRFGRLHLKRALKPLARRLLRRGPEA